MTIIHTLNQHTDDPVKHLTEGLDRLALDPSLNPYEVLFGQIPKFAYANAGQSKKCINPEVKNDSLIQLTPSFPRNDSEKLTGPEVKNNPLMQSKRIPTGNAVEALPLTSNRELFLENDNVELEQVLPNSYRRKNKYEKAFFYPNNKTPEKGHESQTTFNIKRGPPNKVMLILRIFGLCKKILLG